MSTYETKEKSGSLFPNEVKEKDTQPDYKGKAVIDGKTYWLAGWLKKSEGSGKRFLSLKFTEKEDK